MQHVCQPVLLSFLRPASRSLLGHTAYLTRTEACAVKRLLSITSNTRAIYNNRPTWRDADRSAVSPSRTFHTTSASFARKPKPIKPQKGAAPLRVKIPFGSKTRAELLDIFKQDVDYNEGNEVLRILHGRRVTGALVDRGVQMDDSNIPQEALVVALSWLRAKYPVDEQSAAAAWADMEARRVEGDYIARAERLGLYKPTEESAQSQSSTDSIYGKSAIEEFKEFHAQRRAKEAKEKEASGETQKVQELALAKKVEREEKQLQFNERITKRREERAKKGLASDMTEIPDIPNWQRVFAPTAVGVSLIVLACTFAAYYEAPARAARMFPEVPASVATVGAFVGINAAVYLLRAFPFTWKYLNRYTTLVPAYPYAISIFGNTIGHSSLRHILGTMGGMVFWGVSLHEDIGRGNFIALVIAGGILGSISSLWYHVLMRDLTTYSQGASGGVYAIGAAWAYITLGKNNLPDGDNIWPFVLDVGRWATLIFSILPHFLPALWQRVDGMAHLGGAVTGLVGASWISQRKKPRGIATSSEGEQSSELENVGLLDGSQPSE